MNLNPLPEDLHALVRMLLSLANCTREEFAQRAGINPNTLSNYCNGSRTPSRSMIARLARAAKVALDLVDTYYLPGTVRRRLRALGEEDEPIAAVFRQLDARMQGLSRDLVESLAAITEVPKEPEQGWEPAEKIRNEALDLWSRLKLSDEDERGPLVERWREFHHVGLAELLCHESAEAASDDSEKALSLASLAYKIAKLAPGDALQRRSLLGYTLLFRSNCLRVSGNLPDARSTFNEGLALWRCNAKAPTFLALWRVLDLEASLLRDERKFTAALDCLDQALESAPHKSRARILLNKSAVLEQMGDAAGALAVLREAKPLILPTQPRLYLTHRFNLATVLCLVGHFDKAEAMLPSIHRLSSELGLDLTNLRVKWLTGRVDAGRSRLPQAAALLEEVRQELETLGSAWDGSLVTLELATVYLHQGRTAEVRDIADKLVWVFKAQGIHREALAALSLFREAAARDAATLDLTQEILQYLRKAQSDPTLKLTVFP
jgi:transcriptional regulator with XRE-family HTH domain